MDELISAINRTWQAIGFDCEGEVEDNIHAIEVCLDGGCFEMYGDPTQAAKNTLQELIDKHGFVGACRKIDKAMTWKMV
jgi:hypothetical protein